MSSVAKILKTIESGDKQAAAELLPIVYEELRNLAKARLRSEQPGYTLQATDLVHEAYRRLVDDPQHDDAKWENVGHFFGAAAEAMRRILIDRAREKFAQKRGGDRQRVEFEAIQHPAAKRPDELLELDIALSKLEKIDSLKAELVKLRFFTGLTTKQAAKSLGISPATADRYWAYSRAWLKAEINRAKLDEE